MRQLEPMLRNDTRPEPVRRRPVKQQPVQPKLTGKNLPSLLPAQDDHADEGPAVVHGGVPDVQADEDTPDLVMKNEGAGVDDATVQTKKANTANGDNPLIDNDENDDRDNTNDKVVVGPKVPNQEEGGEANDTIVTAKKANAAHGDTDETVGVGPEVP